MSRRDFLKTIAAASTVGTCLGDTVAGGMKRKPNLLFIMTDQQRFDAMSCAGNNVLKTPNMDRLAAEGAFFENAYSACPVCGPARMSMLTGRTIEHTTIRTNPDAAAEDAYDCPFLTYDELLALQGYYAEYHGKWHAPLDRAEVYRNPVMVAGVAKTRFGLGMGVSYERYLDAHVPRRALKDGEQYDVYSKRPYRTDPIDKRHGMAPGTDTWWKPNGDEARLVQPDCHGCLDVPPEHSHTALQGRGIIEALKRAKGKGTPFTIHGSFHFPHAPMVVPEPYYSMYPADEMIAPASIDDPMTNSPYAGHNGRKHLPEYRDREKIKYMISNYYGLVRELDDWLGHILDTLEEIGEADSTLVVFTSDHGEMLGAHGLREKNIFYEESAHVPLIMRLPGRIKAGTVVSAPVQHIDYFATIMDYLGAGEHASDGRSLRGLIEGSEGAEDRAAVSEWNWRGATEPNLMIVHDSWKFMCPNKADSKVMNVLFNLREDPHEMTNLLGRGPDRGNYKAKAEEMKARLVAWLQDVDSPHIAEVKRRKALA